MDDFNDQLKKLLEQASYENNVVKGLHEVCKALESEDKPDLCILASDCSEEKYKKFVEALCKEKEVSLLKIEKRAQLGEWVGLCQYDQTGKARNIVGCSSAVVKKYPQTEEFTKTADLIKQKTSL